jgi:hypothetical protein
VLVASESKIGAPVDWSVAAWSGKGVVRNYNGSAGPCMPELWQRTLANNPTPAWDFRAWVPDTVVVLLGANDFSTPPQPSFDDFSAGLNGLLDMVERVYAPAAGRDGAVAATAPRVVVSCGPFPAFCFQDYQQRVVAGRAGNDSHVTFVSVSGVLPNSSVPGPYIGCDGHPTVLGDSYMAAALLSALL